MASLIFAAGAAAYDRLQKLFTTRRERKETNATLFAQQEAANASRIAALQANTCFCSSSDWDGRNHNDGCIKAAAAARERERAALDNEVAGSAASVASIPRVVLPQQAITDVEEVESDVPPPEYMLVDEHGRKQRWQGRGSRALFQRKKWVEGDMLRVE